jgi:formiminoglutamase
MIFFDFSHLCIALLFVDSVSSQGLSLLFDPISPEVLFGYEHFSFLSQRVKINAGNFPDFRGCDIALIGVLEDRGNPANEGTYEGADGIRRAFYGLRASHVKYNIVDLGNLRPGETIEDSHLRLKEVVRILLENQVFPLIIGGSHDHTLPIVLAYEELGKTITFANIDARSDTESSAHAGLAHHHISRILTRHKEVINRYIHLAYQTYLIDENILAAIDQHHHIKIRLGELRENIKALEPFVRGADFISLDVSAIKMSDAPGHGQSFPFGLTGEEICQIAWYAGCSPHLSTFAIFEFNPGHDYRDVTANVLATVLWYFVEGFYHRADDLSFSPLVAVRHGVLLTGVPNDELVFYKSIVTGKWWMEIPGSGGKIEKVPCLEEDYLQSLSGEIPNRWINHQISIS